MFGFIAYRKKIAVYIFHLTTYFSLAFSLNLFLLFSFYFNMI
ncbi:hypothetical protein NT05HA_2321 [Aggregatibacter aphrophilus NJ8700]|nr:hypothetical protein NT05HA_2321 [Aggregatibacter aphrophilus NJ8700]